MKTVKTPKGTDLPLISLKGKDYLQVAHRLVWFNEASDRFRVETDFVLVNDEKTIARAKVTVFNNEGIEVKCATATKRETKKDFSDHTEKAETGAIGRALALMGYGTQFAIADLDEGNRLADSPVVDTREAKSSPKAEVSVAASPGPRKLSSFRKSKTETQASVDTATFAQDTADNGWGE